MALKCLQKEAVVSLCPHKCSQVMVVGDPQVDQCYMVDLEDPNLVAELLLLRSTCHLINP